MTDPVEEAGPDAPDAGTEKLRAPYAGLRMVLMTFAGTFLTILGIFFFGGLGLVFLAKSAVVLVATKLFVDPLLWFKGVSLPMVTSIWDLLVLGLGRFVVTPILTVVNHSAFYSVRGIVAPLFSRIQKDDLLEQENREMLHSLIQDNPGIGLMELASATDLGWGTVVYHTGRLQASGLIASFKNGQNRHFFINGHPAAKDKKRIAVLRNETAIGLARAVYGTDGPTQSDLGRSLDIKGPTVTKYIKRLEAEGLVTTELDGRTKRVHPTPDLGPVLAHFEDIETVNTHAGLLVEVHRKERATEAPEAEPMAVAA